MVSIDSTVGPQLVEDWDHLLSLGEGAHCKYSPITQYIWLELVLTDTRGKDVPGEENERIQLLQTLDSCQEPGSSSDWLHVSWLHIINIVEMNQSDSLSSLARYCRHGLSWLFGHLRSNI